MEITGDDARCHAGSEHRQWAVVLRVRLPTRAMVDVQTELETRSVLRIWPMRGTIHFVPSRDAHWMLELAALRPFRATEGRWARLGCDGATVAKSLERLGAGLAGGQRRTRSEAFAMLNKAGVDTIAQRGYHILVTASIHGITCIGLRIA